MTIWVTRERPKTDRIACPGLIRTFIDRDAQVRYVPAAEVLAVARDLGGTSFDAPGADYTHQPAPDGAGEWCTFETLLHAYDLDDDPALVELARIVHAADVAADVAAHPFGPGLRAIGEGGPAAVADDDQLLDRATFVYDALYAYCRAKAEGA
jgi:hypothetical protein